MELATAGEVAQSAALPNKASASTPCFMVFFMVSASFRWLSLIGPTDGGGDCSELISVGLFFDPLPFGGFLRRLAGGPTTDSGAVLVPNFRHIGAPPEFHPLGPK